MNHKSIKNLITAGLMIGILLTFVHIVIDAPVWLSPLFVRVEHPTTCQFQTYDKLLNQFVNDGHVDYAKLSKSPLLGKAVDELASMSPDQLKEERERICYWINAYNLLVLKNISDGYPAKNMSQISPFS